MYIWIGCKLPGEFERQVRRVVTERGEDLALDISGFSLPQHISLKISFEAGDRWEEILDSVERILRLEEDIRVIPAGIEQQGNILWVAFRENGQLRRLHNLLDRELRKDFGIPQHLFDKAFRFHSTLCLGKQEDLPVLRQLLKALSLPEELEIDGFLLGISETGKSGTYRIVRQIPCRRTENRQEFKNL